MWRTVRLISVIIFLLVLPASVLASIILLSPSGHPSLLSPSSTSTDIAVTATGIVAPSVTNDGGANNVIDISARLNGEITSTGNENPSVTANGGTDAASWSHNATLGIKPLGAFYYDVSSLSSSTTYFYRMYAENTAGSAWAPNTANFTTSGGILRAPTGLTLTDLGGYTVTANWTKGAFSTYTLIRISRAAFPSTVTTDEWLYYGDGTSTNITGWPLDTETLYISAWSYTADNVTASSSYETANIGGEGMNNISNSLNDISNTLLLFHGILLLLPLAGVSALAFWKENSILFLITAPVALITGLNAPDVISGPAQTTSLGLTVGLMLIVYAIGCAGWTLRLLFWGGNNE